MADMIDHETPPAGKNKTPADEKRREQVLVGAALAGVVLTVLLLRRSSQSAAAAPIPVSAPIGNMGSSGGSSTDFSSVANQLYGIQAGLASLVAMQGQSSSPTAISHTEFNAQEVRDIFARFGDVNDSQIAADTVHPSTETGTARVDRITRELNSGHGRSIDEVTASIASLPHNRMATTG